MDEFPFLDSVLLEESDDELFYVEDEEGGSYKIDAFLGDVMPVFQIFRAKYTRSNKAGDHQIVTLKLARIEGTIEFMNMRKEVDSSFKIGPNDDQENDVITANNIVVGIYKSFYYKDFFCVSMPYMEGGSFRYMIYSRFRDDHRLPNEKCVAVVLRETLKGLCFLHGRGKVHKKLNAGNIFIADPHNPVTIKLGYEGSTYFHDPRDGCGERIWKKICDPNLIPLMWTVSTLPEYRADCERRIRGMYEPSSKDQFNYTSASDIWNLGITAIELAVGGLRNYRGNMHTPDEMRAFLTNFLNNDAETGLPKLNELFIPESPDPMLIDIEEGRTAEQVNELKEALILDGSLPDPADPGIQENQLSSSFIAMVRRCLVLDPDSRPTAQMLLSDPFFMENKDADLQYILHMS